MYTIPIDLGGKESRFYISQLSIGETKFQQSELAFTDYYKNPSVEFVYNSFKDLIHMIIVKDENRSGGFGPIRTSYDIIFHNFKPNSLSLEKPYNPDFSKVNEYYKSSMGRTKDFDGVIQGNFVDKKGNLILMYQQMEYKSGQKGGVIGTFLKDVAILFISPEGKTMSSIFFPFNSYVSGERFIFSANKIKNGYKPEFNYDALGLASEQYFGMDFVCNENASYLLFNNLPENMEREVTQKSKMVKAIAETVAVKYTFKTDFIRKDYLLKDDLTFCFFGSSSYNPSKKFYATICTNPETEKSAIVWVKLD